MGQTNEGRGPRDVRARLTLNAGPLLEMVRGAAREARRLQDTLEHSRAGVASCLQNDLEWAWRTLDHLAGALHGLPEEEMTVAEFDYRNREGGGADEPVIGGAKEGGAR